MNGSPRDYMKIGIVHFMAYPECMGGDGPILESMASLAEDGYFEVFEITKVNDPATRREARALAEKLGVTLCFGAQPILLGGSLDLNHADDAERQKAIDGVKMGIDQAAELGCNGVGVLSGKVTDDHDAAKDRLLDSLKQLLAHGLPKGVNVVLEQFDQVPFGKNCLIGPVEEAVEVSETLRKDYPAFGLMIDLSHLPLLGESAEHTLGTAAAHVVHAHIGNCAMDDPDHPAYGDSHPRFGAPGTRNDVAELTEYLKMLMQVGYISKENRRIVSFEVKPMPGETSEEIIAESKQKLEEAWQKL